MDLKPLTNSHSWDLTPKEAIAVQKHLAGKVIRKSGIDIGEVATVAGVDTHYHQGLAIAASPVISACCWIGLPSAVPKPDCRAGMKSRIPKRAPTPI